MTVSDGYFSGPDATTDASHQYYQTVCPVGSFCSRGLQALCPGGVFGNATGLATALCSGLCTAGYYCPANSTSPTAFPCGDVSVYCPAGSATPRIASSGEYTVGNTEVTRNATVPCPSGSYCVGGVATLCPAGRFGCADRLGDPDCNGPCAAGFFCPSGSTHNQQSPCGGNASNAAAPSLFCPEGSGAPLQVGAGNYSTGSTVDSPQLRTGQAVCPPGAYCTGGVMVRVAWLGNRVSRAGHFVTLHSVVLRLVHTCVVVVCREHRCSSPRCSRQRCRQRLRCR